VPPLFGATHVIFERSQLKADLYALYNGRITYDNLALSEKDKAYMYAEDEDGNPWSPGWFTLNFKASWNLSNRLDLTAGIENLLISGTGHTPQASPHPEETSSFRQNPDLKSGSSQ
jgi:hemoglobin/transferrin/lactoferrin receptor protein